MKIRLCAFCAALLVVLLALFGCAPKKQHFLEVFEQDFEAEIEGVCADVSFCADICSRGGEVTVSFYAPESLADTVLVRGADGTLTLSAGGVSVPAPAPFEGLCTLFPAGAAVGSVSLDDTGKTVLTGEGFTLTFLSDGTPYAAQNECASVRVITFRKVA